MVEPDKSGGADRYASEGVDCVGWLVRLDITRLRARHEDPAAEVDAAHVSGLENVLRLIEADFRQLTVPLLGRSERVLPCGAFIRLGKVRRRWESLLYEKTGDTSLCRVRIRLESSASDPDSKPERHSDLMDEGMKSGLLITVEGEAISSKVLLGRFHPDHRDPNISDAIEYARRLEAERKEKEGGA
jgi:hypothetical protein